MPIHSVQTLNSCPKIAGKTDIIPNQGNQMWIQADATGLYYGQCAEFCGESHALMRFRVIVDNDEDFDLYLTNWGVNRLYQNQNQSSKLVHLIPYLEILS